MADRRDFLKAGCLGAFAWNLGLGGAAPVGEKLPIVGAHLGAPISYNKSFGDIWSTTWADDGNLYRVSDDARGFENVCDSNLAIHRIVGEVPPDLAGTTINPMAEYGHMMGKSCIDGGNWKGAGLTCVDGVLYLAVCRNGGAYIRDPRGPDYWIQEAWDASIVKSLDHGKTWSPAPQIGAAMFPGKNFCYPCFVEYGRNGEGRKDDFIYATSEDGSWNNACGMTIGRVPEDRIGRLDARDWEFFHGFDDESRPLWRPRHDTASAVLRAPGRTSMAAIFHIPALDIHILPQWSRDYTRPELQDVNLWLHSDPASRDLRRRVTRFEFYQSRAPWGPWTKFHDQVMDLQGFYCPVIPSKFISSDGRMFWPFTAGNPPDKKWYRLTMIPATLDVRS